MSEDTPIKQHLDEFNSVIMNINCIDIKIDKEDQTLIVLFSLPSSYETFVETLLYENNIVSLDDVINALKSKELKKNFLEK